MAIIAEEKLIKTIKQLPEASFTILEFMETFKNLFPGEWEKLVDRYGLFGEKRRYTVATYLSNRLYSYSHKDASLLKPFQKYKKKGKGDYRRATTEERRSFGSPLLCG